MKGMFKVIAGIVFFLWAMVVSVQAGQYDYEVKDKKISFAWKVDGDKLVVKMAAETEGWVGIGFNPSKEMKGANFILGYVKDGEAKITDEFGDGENSHIPVDKVGGANIVTLVGGTETGGVTTIEFTIPLKAADKSHSDLKTSGETLVLLAYGGRDSFKMKHTYRTALKVNLGTGASQPAK